ncbi:MAG: hypothetical protein ACREVE_06605 [Gammaproteobacteria bacterium]
MTTGNFQDWAGTISEIGAIYPFVGSEFLLWIVGMAFWIGWHIWNLSTEHREWDEIRRLSGKTPLQEERTE